MSLPLFMPPPAMPRRRAGVVVDVDGAEIPPRALRNSALRGSAMPRSTLKCEIIPFAYRRCLSFVSQSPPSEIPTLTGRSTSPWAQGKSEKCAVRLEPEVQIRPGSIVDPRMAMTGSSRAAPAGGDEARAKVYNYAQRTLRHDSGIQNYVDFVGTPLLRRRKIQHP
jgi:hypothetical protein